MQNFTLRDPQGNIILAAESVTAPVSLESYGVALAEADKAVESAFDETEKYSNAMAVMSSEGFGEQAKVVAGKVLHKIAEVFVKIGDWFAKLGEAIGKLFLSTKFAAAAGPNGKELLKLQGEISKQQSAIMKAIAKDTAANANSETASELTEVYKALNDWAKRGMEFSKKTFEACKVYARGISLISKLTDKSKLSAVEDFAGKAIAIAKRVSDTNFLYETTYKNAITNKNAEDAYKNVDKINEGSGELQKIIEVENKLLDTLTEDANLNKSPTKPAPEPAPTKPAA